MNYKLKSFLRIMRYLNLKTIVFNFKYFELKQALIFPVFISSNTKFTKLKGEIEIKRIKLEPGMIRIGFGNVGIFDKKKSRSILEVSGKIIFEGEAYIGNGSKIIVGKFGTLTFGERFTISAESSIICFCEVVFGKDCLLAWDILVMDTDFHKIYSIATNDRINHDEKIIFGDNCWVGCRSLILKGTLLPDNIVVAANSVLGSGKLSDISKNSIVGGVPARLLKNNIRWER